MPPWKKARTESSVYVRRIEIKYKNILSKDGKGDASFSKTIEEGLVVEKSSSSSVNAEVGAKIGGAIEEFAAELSTSISASHMSAFKEISTHITKTTYNLAAPSDTSWYLYQPTITAHMSDGNTFTFTGGLRTSNEPITIFESKTFEAPRHELPRGEFRLLNKYSNKVLCSSCRMWDPAKAGDDSWWRIESDGPHSEGGLWFRLRESRMPANNLFCASIKMWGDNASLDSWWKFEMQAGDTTWFRLREKAPANNLLCGPMHFGPRMYGSNAGEDSWWTIIDHKP